MNRIDRLAQMGFVVITIGNRGGHPNRSKWYHNFGYGNLRDYGLADKKYAAQQLIARHSFIDGERVVIRTDVQHVDALLSLLPRIDGASVVMVDGIHRDARSRETWQRIVGNNHAAVCYDLYYTGIVMLDQSKHKRCYTINF